MTKDECRQMVLQDLRHRKAMPVPEYLLHQKWEEVRSRYPRVYNPLFSEQTYRDSCHAAQIRRLSKKLWIGDDIANLKPKLVLANNSSRDWTALRILIHTQQHSGAIGRCLNFFVIDSTTNNYLGLISIASDFLDLRCRDEEIGWTRHQRTFEQRIQHTAICSTVVPVQPFGYNYLGGKLLSLLCISDEVASAWKEHYGSLLTALTTTSLYGSIKSMSQYDNLKYWKRMGFSSGSSPIRMSEEVRAKAYEWAKDALPEAYSKYVSQDAGPVRDRLNRFIMQLYANLDIPPSEYRSDHLRGVYFARRYENTDAFLCNKIGEDKLIPLKANLSVAALSQLWKDKYAMPRYNRLAEDKRLSQSQLFYADMGDLSWSQARDRYLSSAGR